MEARSIVGVQILTSIFLIGSVFIFFSNASGRYSLTVPAHGNGIIILDTKTGEMEGCFSKDRDLGHILSCKKIIKLQD